MESGLSAEAEGGPVLISKITIGDRVRKDMGDLRELADSIARHGLLHPVVVTRENLLVAGHRRIEAAKLLGWLDIAATVVDVADLLSAERDENAIRKDFTPTEAVAIGRLVEEQHRAKIAAAQHDQRAAAGRASAAKRSGTPSGIVVAAPPALGASATVASKAVGMDPASYFRAKKVVAAAESEPEKFGDLPALMDETGNVSGTHREMERRKGAPERHPMNRGKRHTNAARVAASSISTIEGALLAFEGLDSSGIPAKERREVAVQLKRLATEMRAIARRFE